MLGRGGVQALLEEEGGPIWVLWAPLCRVCSLTRRGRPLGRLKEERSCCCCGARWSFVASMLMRETVACGRWRREDLSAAGWKAVFSVAERSAAVAGSAGGGLSLAVAVFVLVWRKQAEAMACLCGEDAAARLLGRR